MLLYMFVLNLTYQLSKDRLPLFQNPDYVPGRANSKMKINIMQSYADLIF